MAKLAKLIFVSIPGVGHLKPMIQFANSLSVHFSITVLVSRSPVPEWDNVLSSMTSSTDGDSIEFVHLPLAPLDIPKTSQPDPIGTLSLFMKAHIPFIKDSIASTVLNSSLPIAGVFVDCFATDVFDITKDLSLPSYAFFTSSAAYLGVMLYLPTLDSMYEPEMGELAANGVKFNIPSLANPVSPVTLSKATQNKKTEGYKYYIRCGLRLREATGIVFNSSADLEPFAVEAIKNGKCTRDHSTPKLYPIGPLVRHNHSSSQRHECLHWLDAQPRGSVVFLCFGSMGSFSKSLSLDVAEALERSGHRFLWCLRCPGKDKYSMPADAELGEMLPEGFLDRNKRKGMVWNQWAPQMEILGHEAIGGFVSHCGWNSCLESMWNGVPVLCWPMYAEQKFNAFEMASEMGGLGIDLGLDSAAANGSVGEVLERGVKCLMGDEEEGKKVRRTAEEMKNLCRKSVGELGSSAMALQELVNDLMNGVSGLGVHFS